MELHVLPPVDVSSSAPRVRKSIIRKPGERGVTPDVTVGETVR
jgi:hypothetical protein